MHWLQLEGKVAIVTGGAAGIGRACCESLAEAGAKVAVADIDEKTGRVTAETVKKRFGDECIFVRVDVTSKDSVDDMVEAVVDALGALDILVNNAGVNVPRLLVDPSGKEELTEEIWDRVVAVNQKGFFLCAQAAARAMMKSPQGGVIINMTSEAGTEGSQGQSAYAGTKGAIYALTRSWAKELGRYRIRVVGVAPGILEPTALRSDAYERALAYTRGVSVEELREGYRKVAIPLGRPGTLREVADAVAFLASSRAGYIHGTTVNISGGKSRA